MVSEARSGQAKREKEEGKGESKEDGDDRKRRRGNGRYFKSCMRRVGGAGRQQ